MHEGCDAILLVQEREDNSRKWNGDCGTRGIHSKSLSPRSQQYRPSIAVFLGGWNRQERNTLDLY